MTVSARSTQTTRIEGREGAWWVRAARGSSSRQLGPFHDHATAARVRERLDAELAEREIARVTYE